MRYRIAIIIVTIGIVPSATPASSHEPPWSGRVIVPREARALLSAIPVLDRPYRPFHFYGNAVRRRHHRGRALPTGSDVVRGLASLATRR